MDEPAQRTSPDPSCGKDTCPPLEDLISWVELDGPEPAFDPPSLDPALAEHLAHCEHCQRRLSDSAAPVSWWEAAAEFLGEPEPDPTMPSMAIPAIAPHAIATPSSEADSPSQEDSSWGDEIPASLLEPPSHPELLGRLGRYEIERLIGRGGMGLVFRAFDPQLHRVVAVKLLAPQLAASANARERFAREARAVAALSHPHLVAIHDVVAEGPLPYLVMTYIDGVSLEQLVQRRGPLSIDHTIQLARQLSAALATAHDAGLIHRDIKPGNILCEADGQRAVLTDFGLVRTLDDATLTHSGVLAGTPHFMAPEQARGNSVGPQADLWGVGAVLYFALAGRPPFDAEHPMAVLHQVCSTRPEPIERVRRDIPPALARIVRRLLEKRPADRYRDCASLKEDLDRVARGGKSWWRRSPSWIARRRLRRAAIASTATVLLAIGWIVYSRPGHKPASPPTSDRSSSAPSPPGRVSADNPSETEWIAMQQADRRWRQQLAELYEQTEPAAATDESPKSYESRFNQEVVELLDQLEPFESSVEHPVLPSVDPQGSFHDELNAAMDLLDQRTSSTPFSAP